MPMLPTNAATLILLMKLSGPEIKRNETEVIETVIETEGINSREFKNSFYIWFWYLTLWNSHYLMD